MRQIPVENQRLWSPLLKRRTRSPFFKRTIKNRVQESKAAT
jgi:hypothetical protein